MIDALEIARRDAECRRVVITGAGDRFFCLGGDHDGAHYRDRPIHYGNAFPVVDLYDLIDKHPKPVIAMVNGFAVGGGNVLALICDLTIASSNALFRQVGPMMGSFDAGFGTWMLEQAVGRKRAKEIWYLNKKYSAADALAMGLINEVVEPARSPRRACARSAASWPTAALAPRGAQGVVLRDARRRARAVARRSRPAHPALLRDGGVSRARSRVRGEARARQDASSTARRRGMARRHAAPPVERVFA